MPRNLSIYLFICAFALVFVTLHIPFTAKAAFIWGVSILGAILSGWSIKTAPTNAQKFLSVFISVSFIVFAILLSKGFKVWG